MKIRPKFPQQLSLSSIFLTLLPIAAFVLYSSVTALPVYAVANVAINVQGDATQYIDQQSQATFIVEVRNTSSADETLDLDLTQTTSPDNLVSFSITPDEFTLAAGAVRSVTILIEPPQSAQHDTEWTTTLKAEDTAQSVSATVELTTIVLDPDAIDLSIDGVKNEEGDNNETVEITHVISNGGNQSETFDFTAVGRRNNVITFPNGTSITVPANGSATARYNVKIASNAADGLVDDITFSVTSRVDPRETASVVDTVTVDRATAATATPTQGTFSDAYEPNNRLETSYEIVPGAANELCSASFWPVGDVDFFRFYTQKGLQYVIQTTDLDTGLDPFMTLYDPRGSAGVQHDNITDVDLNARIGFIAGEDGFTYVSIENKSQADPTSKEYCVVLAETLVTPTSTPTLTPTPTETPEPTPTTTLTPSITPAGDECEPNETAQTACFLAIGETINGDFEPPFGQSDDKDFYKIFVRRGIEYTCTTSNLSSYADTKMEIRQEQGYTWLGDNNDRVPLDPGSGSEVVFKPAADGNVYVIITAFTRPEKDIESRYTYDLKCDGQSPTGTPEPTETPEPTATVDFADVGDECEPNETPAEACFIATGQTVGNNFAPPPGFTTDTDYFRMFVRKGVIYTCTTFNLSSFADTRLEIRQEQGFTWLGDNNDAEPFNPQSGSEVVFQSSVDGNVFIIVRPFTQPEPDLETQYTYDLRCEAQAPTITPTPSETPLPTNTPVPTSRPVVQPPVQPPSNIPPTATPAPIEPTVPPLPTPTPFQSPTPTLTPVVGVQPLPTQVPQETPTPDNVTLNVLVYYDANENFSAESTEGIVDVAVSVYDNATGDLLAFGYTNGNGAVTFNGLQPQGALRVNVDYLGFSQVVPANIGQLPFRVSPQQMPNLVP